MTGQGGSTIHEREQGLIREFLAQEEAELLR